MQTVSRDMRYKRLSSATLGKNATNGTYFQVLLIGGIFC